MSVDSNVWRRAVTAVFVSDEVGNGAFRVRSGEPRDLKSNAAAPGSQKDVHHDHRYGASVRSMCAAVATAAHTDVPLPPHGEPVRDDPRRAIERVQRNDAVVYVLSNAAFRDPEPASFFEDISLVATGTCTADPCAALVPAFRCFGNTLGDLRKAYVAALMKTSFVVRNFDAACPKRMAKRRSRARQAARQAGRIVVRSAPYSVPRSTPPQPKRARRSGDDGARDGAAAIAVNEAAANAAAERAAAILANEAAVNVAAGYVQDAARSIIAVLDSCPAAAPSQARNAKQRKRRAAGRAALGQMAEWDSRGAKSFTIDEFIMIVFGVSKRAWMARIGKVLHKEEARVLRDGGVDSLPWATGTGFKELQHLISPSAALVLGRMADHGYSVPCVLLTYGTPADPGKRGIVAYDVVGDADLPNIAFDTSCVLVNRAALREHVVVALVDNGSDEPFFVTPHVNAATVGPPNSWKQGQEGPEVDERRNTAYAIELSSKNAGLNLHLRNIFVPVSAWVGYKPLVEHLYVCSAGPASALVLRMPRALAARLLAISVRTCDAALGSGNKIGLGRPIRGRREAATEDYGGASGKFNFTEEHVKGGTNALGACRDTKNSQILLQKLDGTEYRFYVGVLCAMSAFFSQLLHHPRVQATLGCTAFDHVDAYRGPAWQLGRIHGPGFTLHVDFRVHCRRELLKIDDQLFVVIDYAWALPSDEKKSYFALALAPTRTDGADVAAVDGTAPLSSLVRALTLETVLSSRTGTSLDVDVAGVDLDTGSLVICERDSTRIGSTARWGRLETAAAVHLRIVDTPNRGREVVEYTHGDGVFKCRPSAFVHWSSVPDGTSAMDAPLRTYIVETPCRHVPRIGVQVMTAHVIAAWKEAPVSQRD